MQQYGAPDTDEVVDFEDILDGKCGPIEAAYAQEQAEKWRRRTPSASEPVGQIAVDDTGYDMRVGTLPHIHNRLHNTFSSCCIMPASMLCGSPVISM